MANPVPKTRDTPFQRQEYCVFILILLARTRSLYVLRFLEAPTNFMDEYRAAPPIGDTVLLQYANTYHPQIRHPFRVVQRAPQFGSASVNTRDGGLEVTGKGG